MAYWGWSQSTTSKMLLGIWSVTTYFQTLESHMISYAPLIIIPKYRDWSNPWAALDMPFPPRKKRGCRLDICTLSLKYTQAKIFDLKCMQFFYNMNLGASFWAKFFIYKQILLLPKLNYFLVFIQGDTPETYMLFCYILQIREKSSLLFMSTENLFTSKKTFS